MIYPAFAAPACGCAPVCMSFLEQDRAHRAHRMALAGGVGVDVERLGERSLSARAVYFAHLLAVAAVPSEPAVVRAEAA